MKCYLHIGTEKTGSTTLQEYLNLNRSSLLEDGILFTKSLGKKSNNGLCLLSYPLDRRDNLTEFISAKDNDDFRAKREKLKKKVSKEIKKANAGSKVRKIVFSTEHIQSRLTTKEDLENLKTVLFELGVSDISIVVYLRNPVEVAHSLFSTAIKWGHSWSSPPPPDDPYFGNICNHKATIIRFQEVFGESSVVPRIFEKGTLVGNSIVDDFFSVMDESVKTEYEKPKNANESLSYTGVSLLSKINAKVPRINNGYPNFKRKELVCYFEKYLSTTKYGVTEELRSQYEAYYQESNAWVCKQFFPDKKTLFTENKSSTENNTEFDEDEVVDLLINIWNELYNTPGRKLQLAIAKSKYYLAKFFIDKFL